MKRNRYFGSVVGLTFVLLVINGTALAQDDPSADKVRERYTKYEYEIPVRDGVKLFTAIYSPKDTTQRYPFLLMRTPYSVAPYGVDHYRTSLVITMTSGKSALCGSTWTT